MKNAKSPDVHYVVFDGTSYYVTPETELNPNEEQIIEQFDDQNEAFDYAEQMERDHNGDNEEQFYM